MNKSFSISIGGMAFFIEDLAYNKLKSYLSAIRFSLKNQEGTEEIMQDVEQRIAELFKQKLGTREVLDVQDIEHVIHIMGKPEDFITDEDDSDQIKTTFGKNFYEGKQLFRDTEHRTIGGVCSGMAKFFGIDIIIIRLLFLLPIIPIIFDFGVTLMFSVILYVILWIAIPEAKSTSDKLKMQGKPINIDNIKESFHINDQELKENLSKAGNAVKSGGKQVGSAFESLLRFLGKFLRIIIGISIVSTGILLFILFLLLAIPSSVGNGINTYELGGFFLDEKWMLYASIALAGLIMLIPAVFFIFIGLRLISSRLNIKFNSAILISSIFVWFLAVISAIVLSVYTGFGFSQPVKKSDTYTLNVKSDTLTVYYEDFQKNSSYKYQYNGNFSGFTSDGKNYMFQIDDESLEIRPSNTQNFILEIEKETQGRNDIDAKKNIENIQYEFKSTDQELVLNKYLAISKQAKFRGQRLRVILFVPEGKFVKTKNIHNVSNSENYDNNYYFDYSNKNNSLESIFTISKGNLLCLSCKDDFVNEAFADDVNDANNDLRDAEQEMKQAEEEMRKAKEKIENLNKTKGINITIDTDSVNVKTK